MLTDTVDQVDVLVQDRTSGPAAIERAARDLCQRGAKNPAEAGRAADGVRTLYKILPALCVILMPFVLFLCYKFAIARYAVAGLFILTVTAILALV